ncbi:hypothetical protein Cgig2_015606 [Carnegiea gigantea]|uniref:Uncharacterized protein n=1 Tax=Carnegiea gigantea TaxID=171969 RepID=A0A9Q1JLB8_9CARY|nr:hypothetical protein Cgig2_015606 [Carnegiea gigantea]
MINLTTRGLFLLMVLGSSMLILGLNSTSDAQMVPALFVFGDSLVDVGNNNHLPISIAKANFPHNGIDFPTHKPTGRFSNGKNAADFLAEKLGLPSSPPYLSQVHNKSSNFLTGVSFASGGAGIFDGTDQLYRQSITMNKQIEYFATVQGQMVQQLGQAGADKILSKAVIAIVIGSNDILGYFGSSPSGQLKKGTPQEFVDSMIVAIKSQLKSIYDLGGRKFAMIGIGAVGCCPSQRDKNKTETCNEAANFWASKYNQGLQSVLQEYTAQLKDFQYTYFDTYNVLLNLIQQPAAYGFKEAKAACCGLGNLKAKVACLPFSSYCPNRSDHVFWDLYHPTEATARIIVDTAFNGPRQYAFPLNLQQLASL